MTRAKPRVWGTTTFVSEKVARLLDLPRYRNQVRAIYAGTQKAFAVAIHEPVGRIGKYGGLTGNAKELQMGAKYPGVALATSLHGDKTVWVRLDTEEII